MTDWIKMRSNLWDDPRVSRLCDLTNQTEATIIGGLYWLWATADQHTENGCMPGLTLRQIDRKTSIADFGKSLCDVGWLADDPQGVVILRFEEHNGTSAKRRCMEAQRKANSRKLSAPDADKMRTNDGQNAPNSGARLDKIRRDIKPMSAKADEPPGFIAFWKVWPTTERKVAKAECAKKWHAKGLEANSAQIVAHVESQKKTKQWADGFEPAPLTYINQQRWLDGASTLAVVDSRFKGAK